MKRSKTSTGDNWVRRELTLIGAKTTVPDNPDWTPLQVPLVSRSYMTETHGGGRMEAVAGVNRRRAMTAGLPAGQPRAKFGLVAQDAAEIDLLAPVTETTTLPWRSICQLLITRQNNVQAYGTAWFAGPGLLVTAGHCILNNTGGGWASSITVVPASNGSYPPPFNMWNASGIEAHQHWVDGADPNFDYGFITLADTSIGQQLGWFGFAVLPDEKVVNMLINVAGYPANEPAGTMWFNTGRVFAADSAFLEYMQETEAGESGGPVFWYGQDQRVVVAVHAYHSTSGNKGLRITEEMYQRIVQLRGF